jgi:hypothetical protein
MKVPLAGTDAAGRATETILSEVGVVLLRMFTTHEACVLRLVCREFVEAVAKQRWEDRDTVILGSIAAWRHGDLAGLAWIPKNRHRSLL